MAEKSKKKTTIPEKLLTDVELELMSILWRLGEGAVSQVMAELPKGRNLAYTSVSTILRILEQKEVLKARKEGRGHVYIPVLKKDEYEAKTLRHVVNRVFDGTPVALVKQLLGSVPVSENEIDEIKSLIESWNQKR